METVCFFLLTIWSRPKICLKAQIFTFLYSRFWIQDCFLFRLEQILNEMLPYTEHRHQASFRRVLHEGFHFRDLTNFLLKNCSHRNNPSTTLRHFRSYHKVQGHSVFSGRLDELKYYYFHRTMQLHRYYCFLNKQTVHGQFRRVLQIPILLQLEDGNRLQKNCMLCSSR